MFLPIQKDALECRPSGRGADGSGVRQPGRYRPAGTRNQRPHADRQSHTSLARPCPGQGPPLSKPDAGVARQDTVSVRDAGRKRTWNQLTAFILRYSEKGPGQAASPDPRKPGACRLVDRPGAFRRRAHRTGRPRLREHEAIPARRDLRRTESSRAGPERPVRPNARRVGR